MTMSYPRETFVVLCRIEIVRQLFDRKKIKMREKRCNGVSLILLSDRLKEYRNIENHFPVKVLLGN